MKSRTSFFNATVLRKDITRFAPLWCLYLVGMLLIGPGGFFANERPFSLVEIMGATIGYFSIINFCYALVCGELLFGDLFSSRLCNALHALPLRRESWFATHLICGLAFSVVPNLIVALCLIPQLEHYWFVAFIWLGGLTLSYLFFFGAAVLSAMCTGNRFAMVLVYGLINFLSVLVLWLLKFLYEPLLYGIVIPTDGFILLSPVSYLCMTELNFMNFLDKINAFYNPQNGWPYLAWIAGIGIVMMAGALLLYRRRQLESAGDFITVRPLAPVFHVLYTLVAGIVLHLFTYLFGWNENYFFLVVGIIVGFFTGMMLLKRTVRVFKPATFIGLAVMAAVLFGSMGLAKLDVLGIVNWMPKESSVKTVSVGYTYTGIAYSTEDADEINGLLSIHQSILDTQDEADYGYPVELKYTLNDGSVVSREYTIDHNSKFSKELMPYFSKPECVFDTDDVPALLESVKYVDLTDYTGSTGAILLKEDALDFLNAVIADCEAGLTAQSWNYHGDDVHLGWAEIILPDDKAVSVNLWDTFENTVAWLEAHDIDLIAD